MAPAKHPKPYKEGKTQVTVPWKKRVLAAIAANKEAKVKPLNIDQLKDIVGAKKGSLNRLLKLDLDPPQLTSAFVSEISNELGVLPPVLEEETDDLEFAAAVLMLRSLDVKARRHLMMTAERLARAGAGSTTG